MKANKLPQLGEQIHIKEGKENILRLVEFKYYPHSPPHTAFLQHLKLFCIAQAQDSHKIATR